MYLTKTLIIFSCVLNFSLINSQTYIIVGEIKLGNKKPPYELCINKQSQCKEIISDNYKIETKDTGNLSLELYSDKAVIYQGIIYVSGYQDTVWKNIENYNIELNEVTIGYSKSKKEINYLKTYSKEKLIATGCTNLSESINSINGINTRLSCGVCNSTEIQINNLSGIYTGISVDGIPIVGPLANSYSISGIPTSVIKEVEVNKGPGNLMYGNEGIAGNINIKTREYNQFAKTELQVQSNSLGENILSEGVKFKTGKVEQLIILDNSFTSRKMDINEDGFTDFSQYEKSSTYHKLCYKKNQVVLKMLNRYLYEERWGGQLNWRDSDKGKETWYGESVKTNRIENNLILKRFITNGNVSLIASHSNHKQDAFYGTNSYYAHQRIIFTQTALNKEYKRFNLITSIDYKNIQNKENSSLLINSFKDGLISTHNTGIVLQSNLMPRKELNVLAGMRIDYNNINHWLPSYRLGISYLIRENLKAQIYSGNAYRQIQLISEEHATLNGSRKVEIQSGSLAEKSNSITTAFLYETTRKNTYVEFEVGGFYTSFSDKIIQDYESDPSKLLIKSINGKYVNHGLYINIESNYNSRLKNEFGLTYAIIGINETDSSGVSRMIKPLFNPKLTMNYSVTYSMLKKRLDINLNGIIKSPMNLPLAERDFRTDKSPWYCLVNLVLSKNFKDNLRIQIGINNLLNFVPQHPILRWEDPFNKIKLDPDKDFTFDAAYNYAPIKGIHTFISLQYILK